jgi:hypothetical protein
MSSFSDTGRTHTTGRDHDTPRRATVETKPAFKTTELIVWAVSVIAVLIAAKIADGFGADLAWKYVTWLSVGYMISRGLAKAGSYQKDDDPRG